MFVIDHTPGPTWRTSDFRVAVHVPLGYRRCQHEAHGIQCPNVYPAAKKTHRYCLLHRVKKETDGLCMVCGGPVESTRSDAQLCSRECRLQRNRELQRERDRSRRATA